MKYNSHYIMNIVVELSANPTKKLTSMDKIQLRRYITNCLLLRLENIEGNIKNMEYIEKIGTAGNLGIHSQIYNILNYDDSYRYRIKYDILMSIDKVSLASEENIKNMVRMMIDIDDNFIDLRN